MSVLRDTRVAVLLALVLAGSVLSVLLALTRPEVEGVGAPPAVTTRSDEGFEPVDLVGPGGEALAAAVTGVALAYTYDHRDFDGARGAATATMTSGYAATFSRDLNRKRRTVIRGRIVTRGVVRGAGVVRANGDAAVVCLLYVDQVFVAMRGQRRGAEPEVQGRRVRVAMVLRGAVWKIDGIKSL